MVSRAFVLSVCLFLSGSAALIYEVLWSRQFGLVMGQTVYALSTIVSTFLGGLALGAWLGGRWTRRRSASLRLYAAAEIGIGLTAIAVPLFIRWLDPIFGVAYRTLGDSLLAYSVAQFALCAAVVLVPTVLMGATLPLATTVFVKDRGDVTTGVGLLYAMNTLGGTVGAAVAGFVLLPQLGMATTSMVAACLNLAVGFIAFACSGGATVGRSVAELEEVRAPASRPGIATQWDGAPASLALLYGVSGFAALCLEVGWARLVGLSIGSTTYGFTIILVAFIAGIGLGSLISPRVAFLRRDPLRGIFLLHAVIAFAGVVSVGYLGRLPSIVLPLAADPNIGTGGLILYELVVVFATIALPTLAMGCIFPLLATLLERGVADVGYATGLAYSANTLGNILGSLVAGFVLLPLIGMRASIIAAAALSGLAGVGYLLPKLRAGSIAAWVQAAVLVAVIAIGAVIVPAWQPALLISAPFLAIPRNANAGAAAPSSQVIGEIISFREGASTVVAVAKSFGGLNLYQDGVSESGTLGSLQRYIGHLPVLLHGNAKRALVIGLGAGHTLSAVATHPLDEIDCVEISAEVVDAAREYFVRDGIDDPRVRLLIQDGRNHLRHSGKIYDVIVSQPSQVWLAGASSLFTRDFFLEVRDHLAADGVALSWFYAYTEEARQSIIGAFTEAFPASFLFSNSGVPSLLIGLKDGERLSAAKVARALAASAARGAAGRVGGSDPADVFGGLIAASERMREYAAGVPSNTDDNAFVAFHGLGEAVPQPFSALIALQEDPTPYIDPRLDSVQETDAFLERLRAATAHPR